MPTLEVRWFFPQIQAERPALFGPDGAASLRTDWYAPVNVASGVKLREQKLEVKLLLEEVGTWTFHAAIAAAQHTHAALPAGRVERWYKWIYAGPTSPNADQFQTASWLPVSKRRWLKTFAVVSGPLQQATQRPENGCQAEWTEVTFAGRDWLTVGFEAFGSADGLEDRLRRTVNEVLPQMPQELAFTVESSYSYPAWLATTCRPGTHRSTC